MERIKFHGSSHHQAVFEDPTRSKTFTWTRFIMFRTKKYGPMLLWTKVYMWKNYRYQFFIPFVFNQFRYVSFFYQGSMVFSKCAVLLAFRTLLLAAFNSANAAAMALVAWHGAWRHGGARGEGVFRGGFAAGDWEASCHGHPSWGISYHRYYIYI